MTQLPICLTTNQEVAGLNPAGRANFETAKPALEAGFMLCYANNDASY